MRHICASTTRPRVTHQHPRRRPRNDHPAPTSVPDCQPGARPLRHALAREQELGAAGLGKLCPARPSSGGGEGGEGGAGGEEEEARAGSSTSIAAGGARFPRTWGEVAVAQRTRCGCFARTLQKLGEHTHVLLVWPQRCRRPWRSCT